jgi:hypothetical protein
MIFDKGCIIMIQMNASSVFYWMNRWNFYVKTATDKRERCEEMRVLRCSLYTKVSTQGDPQEYRIFQ